MCKKFYLFLLFVLNCFCNTEVSDDLLEDLDLSDIEINNYISETKKNIKNDSKNNLEEKKTYCFSNRRFYIEALPGYYYPLERRFRDVYGNGGFNGQIEVGNFFRCNLALFLRGGAYWADGDSTVLGNSTKITLGNLTFGLKYVLPIFNRLHFYFGGGGRVFFLRVKNDSSFVQRKVTANRLGGAFVSGFWIYPSNCYKVFFDVFLDYSFYKFNFGSSIASLRNSLKVNGPTIGVGLGYQF